MTPSTRPLPLSTPSWKPEDSTGPPKPPQPVLARLGDGRKTVHSLARSRALGRPRDLMDQTRQRLDEVLERMTRGLRSLLDRFTQRTRDVARRFGRGRPEARLVLGRELQHRVAVTTAWPTHRTSQPSCSLSSIARESILEGEARLSRSPRVCNMGRDPNRRVGSSSTTKHHRPFFPPCL